MSEPSDTRRKAAKGHAGGSKDDPVVIADHVIGCLIDNATKALELPIDRDGKVYAFSLSWEPTDDGDRVSVGLDGRRVLLVDLFTVGRPDKLKKQSLHKVQTFEPGPWVDVLWRGLYVAAVRPSDEY